jgi:hypothetical protein
LAKCLELDDEAKDGCNDMHVISTAVLRVSAHDADMRRHSMAWQLDDGAKRCLGLCDVQIQEMAEEGWTNVFLLITHLAGILFNILSIIFIYVFSVVVNLTEKGIGPLSPAAWVEWSRQAWIFLAFVPVCLASPLVLYACLTMRGPATHQRAVSRQVKPSNVPRPPTAPGASDIEWHVRLLRSQRALPIGDARFVDRSFRHHPPQLALDHLMPQSVDGSAELHGSAHQCGCTHTACRCRRSYFNALV